MHQITVALCVILFPGKDRDLSSCRELISSSAKAVDDLLGGLSKEEGMTMSSQLLCPQSMATARDELCSALQSLSSAWSEQVAGASRGSAASDKSADDEVLTKESATTRSAVRNRIVSKVVYSLPSGVSSKSSPHWV